MSASPVSNHGRVGHRIAAVRRQLGLSQAAFARRLGIGRNTLLNYERDIRLPRSAVLTRIAEAGGVSVDWLLNGHSVTPPASTPRGDRAWETAIEALREIWVQPRRRRIIVEILRALRNGPRD
jgi:transcriptional regulator with XRE-family HTH domain